MGRYRSAAILVASVALAGLLATPVLAKDGKQVGVTIDGDGAPANDGAALKDAAALTLCSSYPNAVRVTVRIKGESGKTTTRCAKLRGEDSVKSAPKAKADGTRKDPIPLGQSADVGGWTVTVTNVSANANDAIAAENQFNDPPPPGNVFFMVGIQATYNGDEATSNIQSDLQFNAVDSGNVSYEQYPGCGVVPGQFGYEDVFQGGTVAGNVCWSVVEANTSSLVMYIDSNFSFDDDPVFFALS